MSKGLVLVADDDAAVRLVVNQALTRAGYEVRVTSSFSGLWPWIENGEGDCVVSDVIMPDGDAFEVLPRLNSLRPSLPVVLISAQNTFMTALKAEEADVFEYLPKPFDLDKLVNSVDRAINEPKSIPAVIGIEATSHEMPLVGRSDRMQEIYRNIARLRQSNLPIMLLGGNGTGKSLIARVIHDFGVHASGPFETMTLAGMSAREMDAALFGDSENGRAGLLNKVANGTVYLRQVQEMPDIIQAKLLQWLDHQNDERLDPNAPVLISSSSEDLLKLVEEGVFREDLYYRLAVVPFTLPPLKERLDDVPDLARHFVKKIKSEGALANHIDGDGIKLLKSYPWPGNVRELENVIRRIGLLNPRETITADDIRAQLDFKSLSEERVKTEALVGFSSLREAMQYFAGQYFEEGSKKDDENGVYQMFLAQFEEPLIIAALRATNGNQIKAADILGLNRNTLRKKIAAHNIRIVKTVGSRDSD